jgi:hypothetical protein
MASVTTSPALLHNKPVRANQVNLIPPVIKVAPVHAWPATILPSMAAGPQGDPAEPYSFEGCKTF